MRRSLAVVIACHALFFIAAVIFTADQMNEVLRGGIIIGCGLGILRWIVGALAAFRTSGKRSSMAILAVVTLLFGLLTVSIYSVLYVRADRPEAWTHLYWSPYFTSLEVVGIALLVASTRFQGESASKIDAPLAAVIAFLGVMLTAAGPWAITKLSLLWHILASALPRI